MKTTSEQVVSAICEEVALVLSSEGADLASTLHRIGTLLEWVLLEEESATRADQGVSLRKPPIREQAPAHITTNEMSAYLQDRFDDEHAVATDVSQIVGGFSKRTTRVSCRYLDEAHDLVLRQIVDPRSSTPDALAREFGVIEFAWNQGLEAPEPYWLEPETTILGQPFFATLSGIGSSPGDVFGTSNPLPPSIGRQLASFTGRLHALDTTNLEECPSQPMAERSDVADIVEECHRALMDSAGKPDPMAQRLFDWLLDNIPAEPRNPTLVHGDIGFHNVLIDGDRLTTVLDWERSHSGDSAEDLAYLKPTLKGVLDWEEFLKHYLSAGGQLPDPKTLEFYTVWQDTWRYTSCMQLLASYEQNPRLSSIFVSRIFAPRFLADANRSLQAVSR